MSDLSALARLSAEVTPVGEKRPTTSPEGPRRKQLRHYDLLPAQVFNPMGSSGIEHLSDDKLWELMQRDNKVAAAFSEICFEEPDRHNVAISRFAEVYIKALDRFRNNKFSNLIIKEAIYKKIIEEADQVSQMLSKLNQAGHVQGAMTSIKNATYAQAEAITHSASEVRQAAGDLYEWLKKDSVLRAFVSYMAGSGVYFAAAAQERGLLCFVNAGRGSRDQFMRAMESRPSTDTASSPSRSSDAVLAQFCETVDSQPEGPIAEEPAT